MAVTYTQQLNLGQLQRTLNSPHGPVVKGMLKRGFQIRTQAQVNLGGGRSGPRRIDTGRLRASGTVVVIFRGGLPAVAVTFATTYARFVHDGTGVHGPYGRPIVPRRAKILRFKVKGRTVWAHKVAGIEPNPFLREAVRTVMGKYPTRSR